MLFPGWFLSNIFFISALGEAKLFFAFNNAWRNFGPGSLGLPGIAESWSAASNASFTHVLWVGSAGGQFPRQSGMCYAALGLLGVCAINADAAIAASRTMSAPEAMINRCLIALITDVFMVC
jgi:hypothetical protein